MKRSFADILQDLDGDRGRKLARKLPEWAAAGAEVPSALALEQCSSSATAGYKAALCGGISPEPPAALKSLSDFRSAKVPGPGRSADADLASLNAISGNSSAGSGGMAAATASGNRATLGSVRGRGPSSDGRGPAQPDVSGGSWPLPEVEAARHIGLILDLTGGMGVDSWAFSKVAERVVYFEREAELAAAAQRNFARLGAGNIEVRCETVTPETELPEADLIYADPARRDASGRKVFLLEDCTPDILTLLPMLLRKAPTVLLKVSPMADLSMLTGRLGPALREIHVVESEGEVKELLCLLRRDTAPAEPEIVLARLSGQAAAAAKLRFAHPSQPLGWAPPVHDATGGTVLPAAPPDPESYLCFRGSEERNAEVRYAAEVRPGDTLLEPCPALLKAGAFRLPCARWGLLKLAQSTHLYLLPGADPGHFAPGDEKTGVPGADSPSSAPGKRIPDGAKAWFKARSVQEVLPFGAAAFKDLRRRFPQAEITARNLPLGSDALRKKMGIAPGGDAHIFACRLADARAALIVT